MLTPLLALLTLPLLSLSAPAPITPPVTLFGIKPFYLVSTTQYNKTANSNALANVEALTMSESFTGYTLVTATPADELPVFTLSGQTLHTEWNGELYNATRQKSGPLKLADKGVGRPNLGLLDGYLLTANQRTGAKIGWFLCDGVVEWKPVDRDGCVATYLQAVAASPYN